MKYLSKWLHKFIHAVIFSYLYMQLKRWLLQVLLPSSFYDCTLYFVLCIIIPEYERTATVVLRPFLPLFYAGAIKHSAVRNCSQQLECSRGRVVLWGHVGDGRSLANRLDEHYFWGWSSGESTWSMMCDVA